MVKQVKSLSKGPEFKRFVDGEGAWKWSTDQTLLNYWVRKENMNLQPLNFKWNALYTAVNPKHIRSAHFVHFFLKDKLPNRGENVEELMKTFMINILMNQSIRYTGLGDKLDLMCLAKILHDRTKEPVKLHQTSAVFKDLISLKLFMTCR